MTSAGPPQPEEPESIVEIRVSMVWDPDKEVKNERAKDHYCRWVKYELGYVSFACALFFWSPPLRDADTKKGYRRNPSDTFTSKSLPQEESKSQTST